MDDENLAWAIILPAAVQAEAIAAAEAAWGQVFGGELAAPVEVRSLPNGRCALVGDTPGMAGMTDLWAQAICKRLGVAGEVLDLDPDINLALAFTERGRRRQLRQGAGVRAEEVGLVLPPPPDPMVCLIESASPEKVAALYHAACPKGRSFAFHAHPLGTLVLPDADGMGPDGIFSLAAGATQLRAWLLRWSRDGSLYVVVQGPNGNRWQHFPPWPDQEEGLRPYLDVSTPEEVYEKLQVEKPRT